MNREILFRGMRVDGKVWAHGSLLLPHAGNDSTFIIGWNGSDFEVKPETVGQYTGLKDRNGVKIFEGDVIKMHNRYAKVWEGAFVVYHRPMFVIEKPFNDGVGEDFTYEEWERDFEVCGNIHTP